MSPRGSSARVAGILLAGGSSTRMGTPKASLPWGTSDTFASAAVRSMADAGLSPLLVVCGEHEAATREALAGGPAVRLLRNPNPDRGQLSSLKLALQSVQADEESHAALVSLIDHPGVSVETLVRLIGASDRCAIAVPRYEGKRGHPVVFGRDVWAELLAAPDADGARPVVRRDAKRVLEVDVDDPAVLLDVDTPADFESLRTSSRS